MNDYNYDNNYNTNYGAGGGAGAGGFVQGDVQSSPAAGKSGLSKETIRPVTIKQLLGATRPHPDAEFKVDGEIIPQITFVGQIRNINKQTTNVTYKIDDGTGIMEVKEWKDADTMDDHLDMDTGKPKLEDGRYCRIWGKLKEFYDKKTVQAFVIKPITDHNEVNYHLLEATYVHLFFKHGPLGGDGAKNAQNGQADGGENTKVDGKDLPGHLSPRARQVYKYLRDSPQSNEGQHVQLIASSMGLSVNDVYRAAEELMEAGLTFTTLDENTWAVLDF